MIIQTEGARLPRFVNIHYIQLAEQMEDGTLAVTMRSGRQVLLPEREAAPILACLVKIGKKTRRAAENETEVME